MPRKRGVPVPLTEPQKVKAERHTEEAKQIGRRAHRKLGDQRHLSAEECESIALEVLVRLCGADWYDPDAKGLGLLASYATLEIEEVANRTRKRYIDLPRGYFTPSERVKMKKGNIEAVDELRARKIVDVNARTVKGGLYEHNQPVTGDVTEDVEVGDFLNSLPAEVKYVLQKQMEGETQIEIMRDLMIGPGTYEAYLAYAAAAYRGGELPELPRPTEDCVWRAADECAEQYCWDGAQCTIPELSKLSGINQSTLYSRLVLLDWSVDQAMTTPVRPKRDFVGRQKQTYSYRGKEYTTKELADMAGMTKQTMWLRLQGWTVEDAVERPVQERGYKIRD